MWLSLVCLTYQASFLTDSVYIFSLADFCRRQRVYFFHSIFLHCIDDHLSVRLSVNILTFP